jgi:hypothetical protein
MNDVRTWGEMYVSKILINNQTVKYNTVEVR